MKNLTIKFGIYSTAFLIGMNLIVLLIWGTDIESFGLGEAFGYTVITLAMGFVFLGIREYKKVTPDSGFLKELKIGALISLFPSLAFGIYNIIYIEWIDPNFFEKYLKHEIDQLTNPTQDEIIALEAQMEAFGNPMVMFLTMFLTVFLIGIVIAIISSLLTRNKS